MYTEPPATVTVILALAGGGSVTLELPTDLGRYTPDQRRAWAHHEIEALALDVLADMGAAHGVRATPEQTAAYLEAVRPGIEQVLRGGAL